MVQAGRFDSNQGRRRVSPTIVAIVLLTVFIGGIFGSMVLGIWNTQTNNQGSGGKNNGGGQKNQVQIQEEVSD
ncbi:MAG: hypothetical protein ABGU93_15460 [Acetobacterium sp.]|uniref:hypothetical protein n=1 Tax=Acetobacterium sp. TaxID=1872094 RepID=UPI00324237AF